MAPRQNGRRAYFRIINKNYHNCLPPHPLDSIQISQSIHLIKPSISAHTRTCSPIPNIVPLPHHLLPPYLPPLLQKLLVTLIFAHNIALAYPVPSPLLYLFLTLCLRNVHFRLPCSITLCGFEAACVSDDAFHACCA